jgi:hypothetical protein
MDATEALEILKQYRAWKADSTANGMPDPTLLGNAIDTAANASPKCWPHEGVLTRYNAWRRDSTGHEVCPSKFSIMAAIEHAIEKWSKK